MSIYVYIFTIYTFFSPDCYYYNKLGKREKGPGNLYCNEMCHLDGRGDGECVEGYCECDWDFPPAKNSTQYKQIEAVAQIWQVRKLNPQGAAAPGPSNL